MMSKQDMDAMNSGDESDHDLISTQMLEDIRDGSQSHSIVNIREAGYKMRDHIKLGQSEWKGALKATRSMGKGLHKVFKTVVKEILQDLLLGESGSEVFHFNPEPRNFAGGTKLSAYVKKAWLKANQKEIKI